MPVLLAGFLMRKKLAIWEANSQMGLANRLLSFFVQKIFVVFENVSKSKKTRKSFYPLRLDIDQSSVLVRRHLF